MKNLKSTKEKGRGWTFDRVLFYLTLLFIPAFFLPVTLSPVALNKQIFAGFLLGGLLIYVLVRFLTTGKMVLPSKAVTITAASVFGAVLLSGIFSKARTISFFGTSPESVVWMAIYVAAFFASIVATRSAKAIKAASLFYVGGVALLASFSILQLAGIFILPFDMTHSESFNPVGGVFGLGFLLASSLVAVLSFVNISRPGGKKLRIALWSFAALLGLIVLQIGLWSIWAAIAVAAVLLAAISTSGMTVQKEANIKPILIPFGLIMISLFFVVAGAQIPRFIANTVEIGLPSDTTWDITQSSLSGARWISGTGPGTFPYNYSLHKPIGINQTDFWGVQFSSGFSAISTYISTIGFLGVGAIVAFLVLVFTASIKGSVLLNKIKDKKEEFDTALFGIAVGAVGSAAVLASALFLYRSNSLLQLYLFISAGLALSALMRLGAVKRIKLDITKSPQVMMASSLVVLIVVSVAFGALYILGQKYVAQVYLGQGVKVYQEDQDLDRALGKLQSAININSTDDTVLRVSSQALTLQLEEIVNNEDLTEQQVSSQFGEILRAAVSTAREATEVNPAEAQNWIQLGTVYENLIGFVDGAVELSLEAYEKARELDPKNPSLPLAQARVYISGADVVQAQLSALTGSEESSAQEERALVDGRVDMLNSSVEYLEISLELKPNYTSANFLLASAYQRLGELDKAIEETEQLARRAPSDSNLAFQLGLLHYQNDDFESAKTELERAVTLADGQFANARYYLGLAYDQLGDSDSAIAEFRQLAQDNPGNDLVSNILANLERGRGAFDNVPEPDVAPPIEDTGGAEESALPLEGL